MKKVKVKGEGEGKTAKVKAKEPMTMSKGDAETEFGNDILDSDPRVAYVYDGEEQLQFMFSTPEDAKKADRMVDFAMELLERLVFAAQDGVKVLSGSRTKWPSGKRPANEPQTVNMRWLREFVPANKEGGAK